jgi:ADP-ribose pyrophosphatase
MTNSATIGTRRVYTGRVIHLDVDHVRFPNGTEGELEMIRHSGASAILPVVGRLSDANPTVLLIRQYRYAAGGFLFEVPAGRLDAGELPEACATRELREETGCTAERLTRLSTIFTTPGFTDERIHLFTAEGLMRGETAHEADEFLEVRELQFSECVRMVEREEIVDSKTITAILLAARLVGRL